MSYQWPKLYIMLLTFAESWESPRVDYAQNTLMSVLGNLQYSGQVSVHIADNSPADQPDHGRILTEIAGGFEDVQGVTWSRSNNTSYGRSYNVATQMIHQHMSPTDVVLVLEDDWRLSQELDADAYVRALDTELIQCVRLGYIGFTQQLKGWFENVAGGTYLVLDPSSPEPHVSSGHPRIETVHHQRWIGPWAEGLDPGSTEMEWCKRVGARHGIAWPLDTPRGGWFHHTGSVQARKDQ